MHPTAMNNAKQFFDCYGSSFVEKDGKKIKVIEIGSQDVNGTLRTVCPPEFEYVGVDFVAGKGVDVILDDPYKLPFESETADIVVSSSCFEHSEMFWLLYIEIMRLLKPNGLFYLNVPANGDFHRYPVDCWRFYPDSGRGLITWAKHNGINATMLESYTSTQIGDQWNDFVAVFLKDEKHVGDYPKRILTGKNDYNNGFLYGSDTIMKQSALPEDRKKLVVISQIISNHVKLD